MDGDPGDRIRVPRTIFTYFPDPAEQESIAAASAEELFGAMTRRPTLRVRFLHECWRTGRDDTIYDIGLAHPELGDMFSVEDVAGEIAFMRVAYGENPATCESFFRNTVHTIMKAALRQPIENPLPEMLRDVADTLVDDTLEQTNARVNQLIYPN